MNNTFLNALNGDYPKEYREIIKDLENKIIPEKYPDVPPHSIWGSELGMESLAVWEKIISLSGYALVAYEWVRPLSQ